MVTTGKPRGAREGKIITGQGYLESRGETLDHDAPFANFMPCHWHRSRGTKKVNNTQTTKPHTVCHQFKTESPRKSYFTASYCYDILSLWKVLQHRKRQYQGSAGRITLARDSRLGCEVEGVSAQPRCKDGRSDGHGK